ncbi:hypothetical protein F5Y15DRAFT_424627 [Xylariaceae sp. FL0016]|nr:hypothetical protein F5Y15DRAFT_424627 [Xylariaceae sp. FL0016]
MASLQDDIYAALFITLGASTLSLILRMFARRITKQSLGIDEFFVVGAYVFGLAWMSLVLLWLHSGLGLYMKDIDVSPRKALYDSRLYLYFIELAYAFSLGFSKLAILCFYWRIFRMSSLKVPIIVLIVLSALWLILRTLIAVFHCLPVQAFWDKSIPNATCAIDDSKFFTGTVAAHLSLDLAILILPILEIRKLKLRTSQKIGVSTMFMFGILVCVASIIVIVYSANFDTYTTELPWNIGPIILWASVEVNLAVVSACLPLLRPVFARILRSCNLGTSLVSSDNGQYHKSHQNSYIQMSSTKKTSKGTEDSDSMHILAEFEEPMPNTNQGPKGLKVVITGNHDPRRADRIAMPPENGRGRIMVTKETMVSMSTAE